MCREVLEIIPGGLWILKVQDQLKNTDWNALPQIQPHDHRKANDFHSLCLYEGSHTAAVKICHNHQLFALGNSHLSKVQPNYSALDSLIQKTEFKENSRLLVCNQTVQVRHSRLKAIFRGVYCILVFQLDTYFDELVTLASGFSNARSMWRIKREATKSSTGQQQITCHQAKLSLVFVVYLFSEIGSHYLVQVWLEFTL